MGQILSLFEAKSLGKYLTQIFSFINGQYLAQIKIQIVKQIGCVDAALSGVYTSNLSNNLEFFWVKYCHSMKQKVWENIWPKNLDS